MTDYNQHKIIVRLFIHVLISGELAPNALINGTMRHRTGERIRVRRYLQIKYIHMTALNTVLLSASRY